MVWLCSSVAPQQPCVLLQALDSKCLLILQLHSTTIRMQLEPSSIGDDQVLEGIWARLSKVAVKGAQHNSHESEYFFAMFVYQLVTNFPSIQKDVCRIIHEDPALLDPDAPLCDQMKAFFLQPLQKLQSRLRGCLPLLFIINALDECTSEPKVKDLIISLAWALHEPDLPMTHILLTSRSETYINKVFQNNKIPMRAGGIISLDSADIDNDIHIFLWHSFKELGCHHPNFPQPSEVDLAKLLMLKLMSKLLPGMEVYKLYNCILSTCANPKWAYMHLSIVTALVDPLSILQISILLGPGLGRDVQTMLVQLWSVMDIPTDNTLPINIYHLSIHNYVSNPSNCGLPQQAQLS
ncbi:uncharacterized protein BJ212DRAFT_1300411 [Suillus subaureus]|uniref:Nephrocystin 3-like N-terminal domain-containing protein n=1 Tax=Suillus subaureus TaxID=48587 RepID=A0A9P7E9Q1_9AGAM|nr:uncharacterized protein BJ212DRAFT_1300411 [Suillus subaureus]KAG1814594.1 hypothetical protein BJ212DRAFT_1300411 [Suillus subaureus]